MIAGDWGHLLVVGLPGPTLSAGDRAFLRRVRPGGVGLFSRNVREPQQIRDLIAEIRSLVNPAPLIWVDHEGGMVTRFGEMLPTGLSPMGLGALDDTDQTFRQYREMGCVLRALGIDGVWAPSLDVNRVPDNPVIGIRAFSDRVDMVIRHGRAALAGWKAGGILPCVKHFPGHGGVFLDPHRELPVCGVAEQTWKRKHLRPFQALLADSPALMSAHLLLPDQDPEWPATLSPRVMNELLRRQWGYRGLVMSDCLNMGAIQGHWRPEEIARQGLLSRLDQFVATQDAELAEGLLEAFGNRARDPVFRNALEAGVASWKVVREGIPSSPEEGTGFCPPVPWRPDFERECHLAGRAFWVHRGAGVTPFPCDANQPLTVVEWRHQVEGYRVVDDHASPLLDELKRAFPHGRLVSLALDNPEEAFPLSGDQPLLLALYHRSGSRARAQARGVQRLLNHCPRAALALLESPYPLRDWPQARLAVCTFGFRRAQIRALFAFLSGKGPQPEGRLPVSRVGVWGRRGAETP